MAKTHNRSGNLGLPYGTMIRPTGTTPLDDRLVVDSLSNLTDGTITAPYQGMVVNIAGTPDLWILTTQGIQESRIASNWVKVASGGSSGTIDYAEDSDIDSMMENSVFDGNKVINVKSLAYFRNLIYEQQSKYKVENDTPIVEINGVDTELSTKEYVDERLRWVENI